MRLSDSEKFVSNPGNKIHVIYSAKVSDNGQIVLSPVGKEDTDDIINSYRESTDISYIIAKLNQGDTSVINVNEAMFGDFTKVPKTFADVLQLRIDSKAKFDSLPVEIKQKFDNDENKFFATAGTEAWFNNLGFVSQDKDGQDKVSQDKVSQDK